MVKDWGEEITRLNFKGSRRVWRRIRNQEKGREVEEYKVQGGEKSCELSGIHGEERDAIEGCEGESSLWRDRGGKVRKNTIPK